MASVKVPTPGRDVWYWSKTGNYALPAKVSVTVDNLFQPGVEAGDIENLDSPIHVHLRTISPGEDYVEQNCPHATVHPDYDPDTNPWPAGSWRWPDIVPDRIYDTESTIMDGGNLSLVRHPEA